MVSLFSVAVLKWGSGRHNYNILQLNCLKLCDVGELAVSETTHRQNDWFPFCSILHHMHATKCLMFGA